MDTGRSGGRACAGSGGRSAYRDRSNEDHNRAPFAYGGERESFGADYGDIVSSVKPLVRGSRKPVLSDTQGYTRACNADHTPDHHQSHGGKMIRLGRPSDGQFHKTRRRRLVVAFKQDTAGRKVNRRPGAHVPEALSAEELPLER
jgi:hypothetical protein